VYCGLGLADESGEVAGKIKKVLRDHGGKVSPEIREALKQELGDVLWYLTQIATSLNYTLEEIAEANIRKLADRLERGVIGGSGDNR
jgi:NTP pyrophosphatase (non-canonical NTP hydrolase)